MVFSFFKICFIGIGFLLFKNVMNMKKRSLIGYVIVIFLILQGVTLPKIQPKFENFVKHGYRVSDAKVQPEFRALADVCQIFKIINCTSIYCVRK